MQLHKIKEKGLSTRNCKRFVWLLLRIVTERTAIVSLRTTFLRLCKLLHDTLVYTFVYYMQLNLVKCTTTEKKVIVTISKPIFKNPCNYSVSKVMQVQQKGILPFYIFFHKIIIISCKKKLRNKRFKIKC